jgi:hypothetical protein
MSNRFKQSIEQLEKASENTPNLTDTPLPFMAVSPPNDVATADFLGDIQPTRQGKDVTFYLSYEVIEALEQISKQRGISKSKVADKALKRVLLKN